MIVIERLEKTYASGGKDAKAAVDRASFTVGRGELVTLLGPSGCGKTTTLRCIAGLERPDAGTIRIDDDVVFDGSAKAFVAPHLRKLGMVFQSYAIWPHMTVFENVAYALSGKGLARADIARMTSEALSLVQLEAYADRPAPRLSGGQQQRVAIARALVAKPRALLFDEPLSNLDAKLREEMRTEIRSLQQRVGLTSVYVTHDQAEALAISDLIAIMKDGKIVEYGRPREIYSRPTTLYAAHFLGSTNLIRGRISGQNGAGGIVRIATTTGNLFGLDTSSRLADGDAACLCIRPDEITVATSSEAGSPNILKGRVRVATFLGSTTEAQLDVAGEAIRVRLPGAMEVEPEQELALRFDANSAVVLADEPEVS